MWHNEQGRIAQRRSGSGLHGPGNLADVRRHPLHGGQHPRGQGPSFVFHFSFDLTWTKCLFTGRRGQGAVLLPVDAGPAAELRAGPATADRTAVQTASTGAAQPASCVKRHLPTHQLFYVPHLWFPFLYHPIMKCSGMEAPHGTATVWDRNWIVFIFGVPSFQSVHLP